MSDRTRSEEGQYVETVTLERVLDVFEQIDGPAITSSDVAEALDCSTEAARQKLKRLYDQGRVRRRKTGRTVLWWLSDQESTTSDVNSDDGFWNAKPGSSDEPTDASKTDDYLADALVDE